MQDQEYSYNMERRQQELLRQSANNFFGGADENEITVQNDIRVGVEEAKSDETEASNINVDKYTRFVNQMLNLELEEQKAKLIEMRDSAAMRALVRIAEDFTIEEDEKYSLLFNNGEKLKIIWEYICASFNDQEMLLTEPGYTNYCADYDLLKKYQLQTGYFLKNNAYKIYKLFRFFIMKDFFTLSQEQVQLSLHWKYRPTVLNLRWWKWMLFVKTNCQKFISRTQKN